MRLERAPLRVALGRSSLAVAGEPVVLDVTLIGRRGVTVEAVDVAVSETVPPWPTRLLPAARVDALAGPLDRGERRHAQVTYLLDGVAPSTHFSVVEKGSFVPHGLNHLMVADVRLAGGEVVHHELPTVVWPPASWPAPASRPLPDGPALVVSLEPSGASVYPRAALSGRLRGRAWIARLDRPIGAGRLAVRLNQHVTWLEPGADGQPAGVHRRAERFELGSVPTPASDGSEAAVTFDLATPRRESQSTRHEQVSVGWTLDAVWRAGDFEAASVTGVVMAREVVPGRVRERS